MGTELTYREALNRSIEEEMIKNPEVFIMGEDIGRYQGTFKVTRGFVDGASDLGPGRNTTPTQS